MCCVCLRGAGVSEVYMLESVELALCRCCVSKSRVGFASLDVVCSLQLNIGMMLYCCV